MAPPLDRKVATTADRRRALSWSGEVNLGHMLTAGAMIVSVLIAAAKFDGRVSLIEYRMDRQREAILATETRGDLKLASLKDDIGEVKQSLRDLSLQLQRIQQYQLERKGER